MQHAVHNRATIRVAYRTDVSGRATAGSISDGSRAKRQSSLWRGSTIFGCVVAVGVLAFLTPAPAQTDPGGVPAEIAALQAQVAALQIHVNTLQTQLAAIESNNALALGPFVSVDPNPENGVAGLNIKFMGANIHILSGSGATNDNLNNGGSLTGLGNLIVGYDETFTGRGGSHNLVIGFQHNFLGFGGLVAGEGNTISGGGDSVSGGPGNTASGGVASVSGGAGNTASGFSPA